MVYGVHKGWAIPKTYISVFNLNNKEKNEREREEKILRVNQDGVFHDYNSKIVPTGACLCLLRQEYNSYNKNKMRNHDNNLLL